MHDKRYMRLLLKILHINK